MRKSLGKNWVLCQDRGLSLHICVDNANHDVVATVNLGPHGVGIVDARLLEAAPKMYDLLGQMATLITLSGFWDSDQIKEWDTLRKGIVDSDK